LLNFGLYLNPLFHFSIKIFQILLKVVLSAGLYAPNLRKLKNSSISISLFNL